MLIYQGKKATFRAKSAETHEGKNYSSKISYLFLPILSKQINLIF